MDLTLLPATAATLDAELADEPARLSGLLGVAVTEWPPIGGEWDRGAMAYHRRLIDAGAAPEWGAVYLAVEGRLVGCAGYHGPPDHSGEVEIGYSVCFGDRRRGIATAAVSRLCQLARDRGCSSVRATTTASNLGSLGALRRNGFVETDRRADRWSSDPGGGATGPTPVTVILHLALNR
jgi:RimJ/RimL family protein N-acetyltransferase